eukprot:UN33827
MKEQQKSKPKHRRNISQMTMDIVVEQLIKKQHLTPMPKRFWNNAIPILPVVLFRIFIQWKCFHNEQKWILKHVLAELKKYIFVFKGVRDIPIEQGYWCKSCYLLGHFCQSYSDKLGKGGDYLGDDEICSIKHNLKDLKRKLLDYSQKCFCSIWENFTTKLDKLDIKEMLQTLNSPMIDCFTAILEVAVEFMMECNSFSVMRIEMVRSLLKFIMKKTLNLYMTHRELFTFENGPYLKVFAITLLEFCRKSFDDKDIYEVMAKDVLTLINFSNLMMIENISESDKNHFLTTYLNDNKADHKDILNNYFERLTTDNTNKRRSERNYCK